MKWASAIIPARAGIPKAAFPVVVVVVVVVYSESIDHNCISPIRRGRCIWECALILQGLGLALSLVSQNWIIGWWSQGAQPRGVSHSLRKWPDLLQLNHLPCLWSLGLTPSQDFQDGITRGISAMSCPKVSPDVPQTKSRWCSWRGEVEKGWFPCGDGLIYWNQNIYSDLASALHRSQ